MLQNRKSMAQQVRKGEELDLPQLARFLEQQGLVKDVGSNIDVSQFSNGYSNLTYLLKVEDQELVLRRPPAGAVKRGHDMSREYKVLSRLYKTFAKSPKALAYTDDPAVIGASFYIMERIEGIILSPKEAKKRNLGAKEFPVIANSWLDTFVELHEVDYASVGLQDLGRPEGYVHRQVANWGKQYLKAATMEVPEAHQVMKWMIENQPKQYEYSLIHNDFKYDNIVFADETWKEVKSVLDWEMCTLGDPLMDLGTSIAYWTMASDDARMQMGLPSPTVMAGNPGREEIVELYAEKSGRQINHLVFYYVFGLFKLAVIAQQIFYRYKKGLTTDKRFAHLDLAAQLLCQIAKQAIEKQRIERLL